MTVIKATSGRYLDVVEPEYFIDDIPIGTVQTYGSYRYMRDALCLWEPQGRHHSGERKLIAKFKQTEFKEAFKQIKGLQKLEEVVRLPSCDNHLVKVNYFADGTGSGFSECVRSNEGRFFSTTGIYNQKGKEILFPN